MAKKSGCNPSIKNSCDKQQLELTRNAYGLAHLFLEQDEGVMAGGVLRSLEKHGTRAMFATVYDKLSKEFGRSVVQNAMVSAIF